LRRFAQTLRENFSKKKQKVLAIAEKKTMAWILLFVLSVLVAMGLLAGQQYVAPKFSQLQSLQATYAGNVAVTAGFIFLALIIGGMLLAFVDKKASLPS
jgi:Ni,Fe-hydrogenase I cytochrome b subunit